MLKLKKLIEELKDSVKPELILRKILDQPVRNITTQEILANSPALLKMLFKQIE